MNGVPMAMVTSGCGGAMSLAAAAAIAGEDRDKSDRHFKKQLLNMIGNLA